MNLPCSLLLLALIAGCSSPRDGADSTPPARDSIADSVASPRAPADGSLMQTSAAVYRLRSHPAGVAADIVYTYTNSTGAPVYLINCNGDVSPSFQRERNGKWENAWGPGTNACLSPPVVIPAGGTYSDTLQMVVSRQDGAFYDEIISADSGRRYRLIWHQALASFDDKARPFGPDLPIEQRVSNPFVLTAPAVIDSGSVGADVPPASGDGAPMRTSASAYQLRSDSPGLVTEIPYRFTNRSGAPIYLTNCNGDVSPALQRERGGKWEDAWWPTMNECLSPPVVIPAGGSYADTLTLMVDSHHKEIYNELASSDGSRRYRLVWHQALASFDGNARPFGERVPIEQRVSNPFVLKKP